MSGIFISFRSGDSAGHAGRLHDRLTAHFRDIPVLKEVRGIEPGVDFVEAIEQTIGSCDVVLAVIGREWLTCHDNAQNRLLDNPNDLIRLELAYALSSKIRLIPLLVNGAMMPPADSLSEDLKHLSRRHGFELRDSRWDVDIKELIAVLEKQLKQAAHAETVSDKAGPMTKIYAGWARRRAVIVGSAVALIAISVAMLLIVSSTWKLSWFDLHSMREIAERNKAEHANLGSYRQRGDTTDTPPISQLADSLSLEAGMSLLGHTDSVYSLAALPGGQLASRSSKEIMLWNLDAGESQTLFSQHVPIGIFPLADGRLVLGDHNEIRLWNAKTRKVEATLKVNKDVYPGWISNFALLADDRIVSTSHYGSIIVWNLKTKKVETIFRGTGINESSSYILLPDDQIAIISSHGKGIELRSLKTGTLQATFEVGDHEVTSLALVVDGKLASVSRNGLIKLWDLATGKSKTFGAVDDRYQSRALLATLPNQRLLVAYINVINLWNLSTGQIERTFATDDKGWISKLLLLPNGRFVTTAYSGDHTIKLWNMNSGKLEATLRGHTKSVREMILLPDGRLASASEDKAIKIWTLPTDSLTSFTKESR